MEFILTLKCHFAGRMRLLKAKHSSLELSLATAASAVVVHRSRTFAFLLSHLSRILRLFFELFLLIGFCCSLSLQLLILTPCVRVSWLPSVSCQMQVKTANISSFGLYASCFHSRYVHDRRRSRGQHDHTRTPTQAGVGTIPLLRAFSTKIK